MEEEYICNTLSQTMTGYLSEANRQVADMFKYKPKSIRRLASWIVGHEPDYVSLFKHSPEDAWGVVKMMCHAQKIPQDEWRIILG